MKFIKETILILFLTGIMMVTLGTAKAGEPKFPNDEKGILEALTAPKSRSYPTSTRSFRVLTVSPINRSIVVETEKSASEIQNTQTAQLMIEFNVDSYIIQPQSYKLLKELGKALGNPKLENANIAINGHTDSDGDSNYNLKLSLNRALTVRSYLVGNFSLPSAKLKAFGYGEENPLYQNDSREHKQRNRRVEIQVLQNQ